MARSTSAAYRARLFRFAFNHQFIMNDVHQPRVQAVQLQGRQGRQQAFRRAALYRAYSSIPFPGSCFQRPNPPARCAYLLCPFRRLPGVRLPAGQPWIGFEEGRLCACSASARRHFNAVTGFCVALQPLRTLPEQQAEVDGFRHLPLRLRDRARFNTQYRRRRFPVQVLPLFIGRQHGAIAGYQRRNPEFNLPVVGNHQTAPRGRGRTAPERPGHGGDFECWGTDKTAARLRFRR